MEIEERPKAKKEEKVLLKETSKNRNLIGKLKDNPLRLGSLKESLKYFTLLKKNHYLERRRYKPSMDDIMICTCISCPEDQLASRPQGPQYSYNCGDRCLNRFTCTECDVELCPCGELCKNRRFQRHEDSCIYPIRAGTKGWGLSAGERIHKGQFIMQYIGEIFYTHSPLGRRRTQEYSKSTCTYLMKINNQEVIDPTYKGNLARFINHSCEPNCITVKWNVLGEVCIGIFANRDIEENEELTFDYQFDAYNTPLTKCLCGTNNCKGYLGLKPTNITQEKWEEHLENMLCKICDTQTAQDDNTLLLCDKCNCGFHMFCLNPALDQVPKDAWFCIECLEELKLQDEKEKERQQLESLTQRKIRAIQSEREKGLRKKARKRQRQQPSHSPSSSSSSSYGEYQETYKKLRELEEQATIELLAGSDQVHDIIAEEPEIRKKMSNHHHDDSNEKEPDIKTQIQETEKIIQKMQVEGDFIPKKKQINQQINSQQNQQEISKKQQLQNIVDLAHSKFIKSYEANTELQLKVANLQQASTTSSSDMIKDCIRVNILEQKVVRKNASLIYQIGNKISFEQVASDQLDFFRKENDLTVVGNVNQLMVFREVFSMIEQIIKELKKELGIVEGQVKVPVLFLKRLVLQFGEWEQMYSVNILYNKQAAHMEEIFPLDRVTPVKIKGSKANIQSTVQAIHKHISELTVYRLYISRSETKTVQQNMFLLRSAKKAEIRISRDSVYRGEHLQRDINHPFFYIQFREKEVCLIGTSQQIQETSSMITNLLEIERTKESDKEVTYFTVLVGTQYKDSCKQVKAIMERQSMSTKVLLFEASHPRKNLTILVLCLRQQLDQVRVQFTDLVQQHCNIKLDLFQDQMSMQMCRYVFKYLQNTMMTEEMAFMKNWDLITPYFFNFNPQKQKDLGEENWFLRRCANSLNRDSETQLYIQYILGNKIAANLNDHEKNSRKKTVIQLMKKMLSQVAGQKKNNEKDRHDIGEPLQFHRQNERGYYQDMPLQFLHSNQLTNDRNQNKNDQSFEIQDISKIHYSSTHNQDSVDEFVHKLENAPIVSPPPQLSEPALAQIIQQAVQDVSNDSSSSRSSQSSLSLKSSINSRDNKHQVDSSSDRYHGQYYKDKYYQRKRRHSPSPHHHRKEHSKNYQKYSSKRSESQYSSYSKDRKKQKNFSPYRRQKHKHHHDQLSSNRYNDTYGRNHRINKRFNDNQEKSKSKEKEYYASGMRHKFNLSPEKRKYIPYKESKFQVSSHQLASGIINKDQNKFHRKTKGFGHDSREKHHYPQSSESRSRSRHKKKIYKQKHK